MSSLSRTTNADQVQVLWADIVQTRHAYAGNVTSPNRNAFASSYQSSIASVGGMGRHGKDEIRMQGHEVQFLQQSQHIPENAEMHPLAVLERRQEVRQLEREDQQCQSEDSLAHLQRPLPNLICEILHVWIRKHPPCHISDPSL